MDDNIAINVYGKSVYLKICKTSLNLLGFSVFDCAELLLLNELILAKSVLDLKNKEYDLRNNKSKQPQIYIKEIRYCVHIGKECTNLNVINKSMDCLIATLYKIIFITINSNFGSR